RPNIRLCLNAIPIRGENKRRVQHRQDLINPDNQYQPFWTAKRKSVAISFYFCFSVTLTDASKARMYEFKPKPRICPSQTDAINDLCRNSSRAWILERCTSMVGTPAA